MKDSGFMLKINNSADNPSPWKMAFLYSMRFDVKFVTHDFVSVSIAVTIKGGNLDSINLA